MQTDMATVGRWTALTAFTPVRRWWPWWLRTVFWRLLTRSETRLAPLVRLSLIGCARWSVFDRPRQPYLPFESNYNGADDEYLEAFAVAALWGMRGTWWGAYGVPDMARIGDFQRYVLAASAAPSYYHCAYPEASAKMIRSALELERLMAPLRERAAALGPERFEAEYLELLGDAASIRNPAAPAPRSRTATLSVLTPVLAGQTEALRADLRLLAEGEPPVPPDTTHFARWTVVPPMLGRKGKPEGDESYLLFSAWFDGDEDAYLNELHARLGPHAERIWRHAGLEPGGGREAFRGHLLGNRLDMGLPFLGYDGVSVREIRRALDVQSRFADFAARFQGTPPAELRAGWLAEFG